jgi:hypothetical protein
MVSSSAFAGQTSSGGGIAVRQIAENLFRFPEGHDLGGLNLDDEIEIEGGVFRVVGVSALTGNIIMQSASGARIEIQAGSDFPIDSMPQQ